MEEAVEHPKRRIDPVLFVRIGLVAGILLVGILAMVSLASMRQPPGQVDLGERTLQVAVRAVQPEDVPVMITGFGEAQPLNMVTIAPEVSGTIVDIHPRLDAGEVIDQGDLLFRIDPRTYQANFDQATAQMAQAENALARLERQFAIDRDRLQTLSRNVDLARDEFGRIRSLFEDDQVGTQSGVDGAEIALNQTTDARDLLAQQVDLYPIRIEEARAALEAARATADLAQTNLDRTEVRTEFAARIETKMLEVGQFVSPGQMAVMLADDSVLEIEVPIDSRDARRWLRFADSGARVGETTWFGNVEPVECRITWTEGDGEHAWRGTLHRVAGFDERTRTVRVAVRVSAADAAADDVGLPLVDGMFCEVSIPGKTMRDVFRLPSSAVSFEGDIYVANEENRLEIRTVDVVRTQGGETFVQGNLQAGERIIVTRLVNPFPNTLLEYTVEDTEEAPPEPLLSEEPVQEASRS